MKRFRVLPYRQGSKSAKSLAQALGGKVLKLQGSQYIKKENDVVINWGCTESSVFAEAAGLLNRPTALKNATNKRNFFQKMVADGLQSLIPDFWVSQSEIPADAFPIVCRTTLAGHSGDGIVIAADAGELVPAPLYVRYVKKKDEYRVHVGKNGEEFTTIAVQRKARRTDIPDSQVNWQVRNHHNGFVFVRQGVNPHTSVISAARDALASSGLDFGAVDVIWNDQQGKAYVLEINTAPGLEGQTVEDYKQFFQTF